MSILACTASMFIFFDQYDNHRGIEQYHTPPVPSSSASVICSQSPFLPGFLRWLLLYHLRPLTFQYPNGHTPVQTCALEFCNLLPSLVAVTSTLDSGTHSNVTW